MDKNENGYPGGTVGGVTDNNGMGGGCGNGCGGFGNGCGCGNGNGGNVGGIGNGHTCGGNGTCLDNMLLAYVYAPDQKFRLLYSANDALKHGTLFEELYKPKEVYGRE